jgi:hypothetical protein
LGVKQGAIVYLDEVVEARKDTTVIIHPLSDDRRLLPIEKKARLSKPQKISSSLSPTIPAIRMCSRI